MKINKKFIGLYALVFVLYLTIITVARYTGKITSTGISSVAKWEVSLAGDASETLDTITIGNVNQEYILSVTSTSDVATDYKLLLADVPDELIIEIDGVEYTPTNNEITIDPFGHFNANDNNSTHNHSLIFKVPIDSDEIDNETINIDVVFTQTAL